MWNIYLWPHFTFYSPSSYSPWLDSISQWNSHIGVFIKSTNICQRDTRLCPYWVKFLFYSRNSFQINLPHATRRPPHPHRPPVTSLLSSLDFPTAKTSWPPPAWYRALVISPSLTAPPDPLGAGDARPVDGSEPSLTAHLWWDPPNTWLYTPQLCLPGIPGTWGLATQLWCW